MLLNFSFFFGMNRISINLDSCWFKIFLILRYFFILAPAYTHTAAYGKLREKEFSSLWTVFSWIIFAFLYFSFKNPTTWIIFSFFFLPILAPTYAAAAYHGMINNWKIFTSFRIAYQWIIILHSSNFLLKWAKFFNLYSFFSTNLRSNSIPWYVLEWNKIILFFLNCFMY